MPTVEAAGWTITELPVGRIVHHDGVREMPVYAVVCRRDGAAVVFDTGSGVFDEQTPGGYVPVDTVSLSDALAAAGCPPDEVTTVAVSHLDSDHVGGLVTGSFPDALAPALPHARVVMLDLALDCVREGRLAGAELGADVLVAALERDGVTVEGVPDGAEIAPGIVLCAAPGHRAANAYFDVAGPDGRYVFVADVFHGPDEVLRPRAPRGNPYDQEAAIASRVSILESLDGGETLSAAHMSFGRVERSGDGWLWHELSGE